MEKLYYCNTCLNNNQVNATYEEPATKTKVSFLFRKTKSIVNNGFIEFKNSELDHSKCPHCDGETIELSLTTDDWNILKDISTDADFILEMDKLKKSDIVDFNLKMSQFKANAVASKPVQTPPQQSSVPRCPTCGSTNIKKISGTKRWVTTGMFGLGSSNVGKTMQCGNCGYKF